eukprot:386936_1
MGSEYSEQKEIEDITTKSHRLPCNYKDYRSVVVHRYCDLQLLHDQYQNTSFTSFCKVPKTVMALITSYIPLLYQIYKISKVNVDTRCLSHNSHCRASSPTPSMSSVSSMTSSSLSNNHKHRHTKDHIQRLYAWESIIYCTKNIYQCGPKYFIRAANQAIYGIGHHKHVSLGSNLLLMSKGICAQHIAIKYQNGHIYTSKIGGKSFNKFASLQHINIIQIECGHTHSLLLSDEGNVYTMGTNDYGQCGIGDTHMNPNQIAIIDAFIKLNCVINSISCGYRHSVCVDAIEGNVYCFGDNTFYQCSAQNEKRIKVPKAYRFLNKINDNTRIIKAECGKNFTAVLTEKGYFYAFGRAKFILKSKNHRDAFMENGIWYNTNRVLYRDFSVGLDHIILITKHENKVVTFGYRFDKYDTDIRVIGITDSLFEIDKTNFDGLSASAQIHKVIAGIDNCILIFKN